MNTGMRYFVLAFFITLIIVGVIMLSTGIFSAGGNSNESDGVLYVGEKPLIVPEQEIPESDSVSILSASIFHDRLVLAVSYSECEKNAFTLYVIDSYINSNPPSVRARLVHQQEVGMCGKSRQMMLDFSLDSIKEKYGSTFRISIEDTGGNVTLVDVSL